MIPELKDIKIGQPAQSALKEAGVDSLIQLCNYTEKELLLLHGIGPKAVRILKELLAKEGLSYLLTKQLTKQSTKQNDLKI